MKIGFCSISGSAVDVVVGEVGVVVVVVVVIGGVVVFGGVLK